MFEEKSITCRGHNRDLEPALLRRVILSQKKNWVRGKEKSETVSNKILLTCQIWKF